MNICIPISALGGDASLAKLNRVRSKVGPNATNLESIHLCGCILTDACLRRCPSGVSEETFGCTRRSDTASLVQQYEGSDG
jgi:hypothetical protein